MTVEIHRADGCTEFFTTSNYLTGKPEDTHPAILSFKVYADSGRLLKKWRRPHQRQYIKNYKPEVQELHQDPQQTAPAPETPEVPQEATQN